MWGVLLILLCVSFESGYSVTNITVHCKEFTGPPPHCSDCAPSRLEDLAVSLTPGELGYLFNISWAVTVDSTTKYVKGVIIDTSQEELKCEYSPAFSEVASLDSQPSPIWFHHTTEVFAADVYTVTAKNIPLPPVGNDPVIEIVTVYPPPKIPDTTLPPPSTASATEPLNSEVPYVVLVSVVPIVCLTLVVFGYAMYKLRDAYLAIDYQKVCPALSGPPVPVLVLYPAESAQFQWAVGALVEFLHQHGGCSVAVDMWQQGCVAKLGPMRWLLEQVQAAHRVLIVAAQPSPQMLPAPGVSIPATAQDLYALALNLVAGQAKNSTDLAKFWVVRFGASGAPATELKACRSFSLMKDLNKLCRCLHKHKQESGVMQADFILRRNYCSGDSTEKLRAAVEGLNGQQGSV